MGSKKHKLLFSHETQRTPPSSKRWVDLVGYKIDLPWLAMTWNCMWLIPNSIGDFSPKGSTYWKDAGYSQTEEITAERKQPQSLKITLENVYNRVSPAQPHFFFSLVLVSLLGHCLRVETRLRPHSYSIGNTMRKKILKRGFPVSFSQITPGQGLGPGFAHVPILGQSL